MKYISYLLFLSLIITGCNKEKRFSKKLMKGETWKISSVTIENESSSIYGRWLVTRDVNIYDSVPSVEWTGNNGDKTHFNWQFQDKGKTFEIAYSDTACINCSETPSELDLKCSYLSGKYKVEVHKKNRMRFLSTDTQGFSGKKVEINIERTSF